MRDQHCSSALSWGDGITFAGMITRDWELGANVTDWKLVDVPDLGYYTTDKPFPRGELLIKTMTMIDGYYKHQDVSCLPCTHICRIWKRMLQHFLQHLQTQTLCLGLGGNPWHSHPSRRL